MSGNITKFLLLVAVPSGLLLLLLATLRVSNAAATQPTTAPTPAFEAMAYYDQNCAHCHGPQGTFYGPTLGQKLSDQQLIKVVDDMASGPGNAPLKPDQLAVETAFHRALIMRVPFLSVTKIGVDGKWAGEAMPDAKLTITLGSKQIETVHDDATWSATFPAGTKVADVRITAELNGAMTTLNPGDAAYSNATPLPDPTARSK